MRRREAPPGSWCERVAEDALHWAGNRILGGPLEQGLRPDIHLLDCRLQEWASGRLSLDRSASLEAGKAAYLKNKPRSPVGRGLAESCHQLSWMFAPVFAG